MQFLKILHFRQFLKNYFFPHLVTSVFSVVLAAPAGRVVDGGRDQDGGAVVGALGGGAGGHRGGGRGVVGDGGRRRQPGVF